MSGLHFTLSEDQAMVVETARRLLRTLESQRDRHLRMIYDEQQFPEEVWLVFPTWISRSTSVP